MSTDDITQKQISELMKEFRAKRKTYDTAGFNNPEVQAKIQAIKKAKREKKSTKKEVKEPNPSSTS